MAYIGKQPVVGNFVKLDAITTSATATYNLLNGGVAYFPQTANNCIVSLNGVIQSPTSAYTISGSTIVFSDALTASDSIDFILVLGDVLSIGTPSDGTITSAKLASGTDGLFAWQSVQTTGFTAVAARAYPCNTTSAAFTVTLPASPSVGDQVAIVDYAGTFATNAITLSPNGLKINGSTGNRLLNTSREGVIITYIDSTQGWVASSGVNEGTVALSVPPYSVDFLIIAGGGGGGGSQQGQQAGSGGAGGYRNSYSTETSGGGGTSESSLTFTSGTVYTITVGAGGSGGSGNSATQAVNGTDTSLSGTGISTITSIGGGYGGNGSNTGTNRNANSGGSGGAGGTSDTAAGTGGSGTANQGYAGANAGTASSGNGASGGGAGGAGSTSTNYTSVNTAGGIGLASSITGSSVTRGVGGTAIQNGTSSSNATSNTGNGGDGNSSSTSANGYNGGSGVVILRMPTASYSSTTTGSPTVSTSGSDTILVYNSSGTYTG